MHWQGTLRNHLPTWTVTILLALSDFGAHVGSIPFLTVAPDHIDVSVGGDVQFSCSSVTQSHIWQHKPIKYKIWLDVFKDGRLVRAYAENNRYDVKFEPTTRESLLSISEVHTEDAGNYSCTDGGAQSKATFIVSKHTRNLTQFPSDAIVLAGRDVRLKCSTSSNTKPVFWQHSPVDTDKLHKVYFGDHIRNPYDLGERFSVEINKSIGQYDLLIKSVEFSDAGTYYCTDDAGQGQKASAELFVLDSFDTNEHKRIPLAADSPDPSPSCTAKTSHVLCEYHWNKGGTVISHDSVISLNEPGLYQCRAACNIRGNECQFQLLSIEVYHVHNANTDIEMTTYENEGDESASSEYVFLVLFFLIFICALLLGIAWKINKMKQYLDEKQRQLAAEEEKKLIEEFGDPGEEIRGLAVLKSNIYVYRQQADSIEVHEFKTNTGKSSHHKMNVSVGTFGNIRDMVACEMNSCLYLSDEANSSIHEVDISQPEASFSWSVESQPEGLSFTHDWNLIVTLLGANAIAIYTTNGKLLRKISLHKSIAQPWHALQLKNGKFLVSYLGDVHGICLVDSEGQTIQRQFPTYVSDAPLKRPLRMALNTSYDKVFVADYENDKIVILVAAKLNFVKSVEVHLPQRLCFDTVNNCLFISKGNPNKISVLLQTYIESLI